MASNDELQSLLEEVDALFPERRREEKKAPRKSNDEVLMMYHSLSLGDDTGTGEAFGPPIPARNGDRHRKKAPLPGGPIPAYNADVRRLRRTGEMPDTDLEELLNQPEPPRKQRRGCGCVMALPVLAAVAYLLWRSGWIG